MAVGCFHGHDGRPDDRLAGLSSFIGHPGAKNFSENSKGGERKEKEPNTREGDAWGNERRVREKEIRNGVHSFMDLSHWRHPEVFFGRGTVHKTVCLEATPRFGLGPWIGARVASQRCPILRPGRPALSPNGMPEKEEKEM